MGKGISDFRAITKASFARANLYEVSIYRPSLTSSSHDNQRLHINCKSANIPSRSLGVSEPDQGYRAFAESGLFENEISLSFNMSADFMELRFFQDWLDYIVKPNSRHIEYYDNYIGSLKIINKDRNQQKALQTNFRDVYPKTISALSLEAGQASEVMSLEVTMAYRDYEQTWYKEQRTEPNVIPEPVKVYATKTVDTVRNQINPMLELSKEQWKFQGGGHDDTDVGE
jgi:hypothetical protein